MKTACIFLAGDPVPKNLMIPQGSTIIAADKGQLEVERLGLKTHYLVGDFDSLGEEQLATYEKQGVHITKYPTEKDATDFELCMDLAMQHAFNRIVVIGGFGGELDHFLGNAFLLASDKYEKMHLEWWAAGSKAVVVSKQIKLKGKVGDTISIFSLKEQTKEIQSSGLKWNYRKDNLDFGSSLGLRNIFMEETINIEFDCGRLLVIHQG